MHGLQGRGSESAQPDFWAPNPREGSQHPARDGTEVDPDGGRCSGWQATRRCAPGAGEGMGDETPAGGSGDRASAGPDQAQPGLYQPADPDQAGTDLPAGDAEARGQSDG